MSAIARWFQAYWPQREERNALLRQYHALQQSPLLLQDIAYRGSVFQPIPPGSNAQIMEGRRQLALEILNLAKTNFDVLHRLANTPLTRNKDTENE